MRVWHLDTSGDSWLGGPAPMPVQIDVRGRNRIRFVFAGHLMTEWKAAWVHEKCGLSQNTNATHPKGKNRKWVVGLWRLVQMNTIHPSINYPNRLSSCNVYISLIISHGKMKCLGSYIVFWSKCKLGFWFYSFQVKIFCLFESIIIKSHCRKL